MSDTNLSSSDTFERASGRANDALRPIELVCSYTRYAEGSVLIRMGDTHVLCNASVLDTVPPFLRDQNQGWVTAEYGMLPRATHTRSGREAARGRQGGRTLEIQRLIGRSLRAVFDLTALGERTIHIDCDVLQADGGTRCASITGAWVAAAQAVAGLQEQGLVSGNPLTGQVAAVSVGLYQDRVLLDLDYTEDANCGADINVVMAGDDRLIEIQGTAEGHNFSRSELHAALDVAQQGISKIMAIQRQALQP